jgi:tRNA threonylcarbamoyladenosine biosynthesis protein TsaB
MRIIAIDTSNQPMSVALFDDQGIVAERTTTIKRNHSIQLMPAIESMMKEANWSVSDLDRVAVAKGPGSYTGVRIGVTVAKTLAWTANLELVGVSSLKMLAGNASLEKGKFISPLFDARRGNIYTGLYQVNDAGKLVQVEEDTHISAEEWASFLQKKEQPIEIIGQDASKHTELFEKALNERLIIGPKNRQIARASVLAELALEEEPVEIHTFTPEYTKLAEAEEKWKAAHPDQAGGVFVEKI